MTNLRVNCPKCGALLGVDEVHIGRQGQCKRCGAKFIISPPTDSQQASPAAIPLQQDAAITAEVRTSGLAIASFVLGILSIFTLCLTAIPAIVLGIVGLVKVEKSGGRLRVYSLASSADLAMRLEPAPTDRVRPSVCCES